MVQPFRSASLFLFIALCVTVNQPALAQQEACPGKPNAHVIDRTEIRQPDGTIRRNTRCACDQGYTSQGAICAREGGEMRGADEELRDAVISKQPMKAAWTRKDGCAYGWVLRADRLCHKKIRLPFGEVEWRKKKDVCEAAWRPVIVTLRTEKKGPRLADSIRKECTKFDEEDDRLELGGCEKADGRALCDSLLTAQTQPEKYRGQFVDAAWNSIHLAWPSMNARPVP